MSLCGSKEALGIVAAVPFSPALWVIYEWPLFSLCAHVYMCVRVCAGVFVETWTWSWKSSSITLCVEGEFHLNPESFCSVHISSHLASGIPCLHLLSELQIGHYGCVTLNIHSHACAEIALTAEAPPQPWVAFISYLHFKIELRTKLNFFWTKILEILFGRWERKLLNPPPLVQS